MTYVTASERRRLITGLRDLADFLENDPRIPAPLWVDAMVFPPTSIDQEMRAEVDWIAALTGAEISDMTTEHGHYVATRKFGPVEYSAVGIPARSRAHRDAQMSYSENIIVLEEGPE